MKKKCLFLGLVIVMCLFNFKGSGQSTQQGFDNYITISNGQFWDGNTPFYPVCVNYLVVYPYYQIVWPNRIYYISPILGYSNIKREHWETGIYNSIIQPEDHWGYGDDGATEMDSAGIKLEHDLQRINSLGFNVVRLNPSIHWSSDNHLIISTGSYSEYFRLTDSLIAKCARNNLRVIMVLSDKVKTYEQFDQYCVYLDSVTRHYSNNKTVMAYVVYMEPGYKWVNAQMKDKLKISNWARKWYYIAKKNAPDQLVTYALDGINNVLFWDPSALTYDFLTMHFYHNHENPNISNEAVACYFKWMNDNVEDVWVLGETGYSGTTVGDSCLAHSQVGTETAQSQYAEFTRRRSAQCGCKGYAWWQYQEVNWEDCTSKHFGLVTFYPEQRVKPAASAFSSLPTVVPDKGCVRPDCYYNIFGYEHDNFSGVVRDENSNPIKDAFVVAFSNTYKTSYSTFTDSQGEYTIHTPEDTVVSMVWVSHNGYTDTNFYHNYNSFENTTLTRINYNKWEKNWTGQNYPIQTDDFPVRNADAVVVGNFYDDEAQEVFLINSFSQTASLYRYNINHLELMWEGVIADWQISSGDKFYAFDFNGDGIDELLCVRNASNSWASVFAYEHRSSAPWRFVWTNFGNGNIGNWNYAPGDVILPGHFTSTSFCSLICIRNSGRQKGALCQRLDSGSWTTLWTASTGIDGTYIGPWRLDVFDKYYVGDFSADGIDELFCVQATQGSSDKMTLMQYNSSWSSLWSNNGISQGVDIYPYRANLHVGNYDPDLADELLGVGTEAAKFDLNASNQWDKSWSTDGTGRLSDWSVNPNHRIFFMKTMSLVPDYLFVSRIVDNHYHCDGYSFDP